MEINRIWIEVIIILLLLVSVIGLVYIGVQLNDDGAKCIDNPINYYNSLGTDKCYITCLSDKPQPFLPPIS